MKALQRLHADFIVLRVVATKLHGRARGPARTLDPVNLVRNVQHAHQPRRALAGNILRPIVQRQQIGADLGRPAFAVLKAAHVGADIAEVDGIPYPVHPRLRIHQAGRTALGFTHRPHPPGPVTGAIGAADLVALAIDSKMPLPVPHLGKARVVHDQVAVVVQNILWLLVRHARRGEHEITADAVFIGGETDPHTPQGLEHFNRQRPDRSVAAILGGAPRAVKGHLTVAHRH